MSYTWIIHKVEKGNEDTNYAWGQWMILSKDGSHSFFKIIILGLFWDKSISSQGLLGIDN